MHIPSVQKISIIHIGSNFCKYSNAVQKPNLAKLFSISI